MAICPSCGVKISDNIEKCPLCQTPLSKGENIEQHVNTYPDRLFNAENLERISFKEIRKIIIEIVTISCLLALVITGLIDIMITMSISWSRYTALSIMLGWFFVAIPFILWGHPWLSFTVLSPVLIIILFLYDIFDGTIAWFLPVGLPIALLAIGLFAGSLGVSSGFKQKGLNVLATILAGVMFFLIGIELTLNLFLLHKIILWWSLIASFALFPTTVLFYFLHYRIMRRASLRKLFRL